MYTKLQWVLDLIRQEDGVIQSLWNHQKVALGLLHNPKLYKWPPSSGKTTCLILETIYHATGGKKVGFIVPMGTSFSRPLVHFDSIVSSYDAIRSLISFKSFQVVSRFKFIGDGDISVVTSPALLPFDPDVLIFDDIDKRRSFNPIPGVKLVGAFSSFSGAAKNLSEGIYDIFDPVLPEAGEGERAFGRMGERYYKESLKRTSLIFDSKGNKVGTKIL